MRRLFARVRGEIEWRVAIVITIALWGSGLGWAAAAPADGRVASATAPGPQPPTEAVRRFTLPPGFSITLFAAEPDVVQPIAMTIDHRGRLWVVENTAYPLWLGGPQGKDRVLIFEDQDGDGRFDRKSVFWDKGTNFTGIELGFGGVYICATPNLLFFPDRDGDDRPDGEPVVLLDGWDTKGEHNVFNGLKWAPDGWLWGCNGIMSHSRVGKPGTPDDLRVAINCGVWRYHPSRAIFEAVAHGTTNPWGLDFDDLGEAFITNCVIPHLFHVVPGAHFQRMYGEDLVPNLYSLLESCADHIHWAGGNWTDSRDGKGKHGEAGGGHAHVGAMIYLGDNWPDRYRNDIFTCNLHGRRVNRDRLERQGSGYVARHDRDFLMANDPWFRGLELKYGPDGAVFLTDWYDTGECHDTDADNAHRENGRIYKIGHGTIPHVSVDLSKESDEALARLQLHHNDWYVRTSRRLLEERSVAGRDLAAAHRVLREILDKNPDVTRQLRAIWALHATGALDGPALEKLLDHQSEHVRSWAVRLLADSSAPPPRALARFAELARTDRSPKVRLSLASALQRMPIDERLRIALPLASHAEDAADRVLPAMIWYGIEPLVASDGPRMVEFATRAKLPLLTQFVARRLVSADPANALTTILAALVSTEDAVSRDLVKGAHDGLRGRKRIERPANWPAAFERLVARPDLELVEQTLMLALDLQEPRGVDRLRQLVRNTSTPTEFRRRALAALVDRRAPGLAPELQGLLADPALRAQALRALAAYDDPTTPDVILAKYSDLTESERDDAVATLAARPAWAVALLEAIGRGQIARRDLNVTTARQLQARGDRSINELLTKVWGTIQPTSKAKTPLLARYKALLESDAYPPPDLARGRAVFNRTCLACHRLFDAGGDVGPDLTGSDRATVSYLLENILDPSAAVGRDYVLTNLATTDGRMISGIIREQSESAVVIQTANERIIVPREDVEAIKPSSISMMPEGQLERLAPEEIRDLFAYLAAKSQVPLPPPGK